MKKIVLIGNPNVGKSAIFSRLTGIDVITSNCPGTTVEFAKGYLKTDNEKYEIIDVPGIYSLNPTSKAEEVSLDILKQADIIINVIDSTNLERNLGLTLQLLTNKMPILLILNIWDEAKHTGISIDLEKIRGMFNVPIIPTCAITGEGIIDVINNIKNSKPSSFVYTYDNKWEVIGKIVDNVQNVTHRHHTLLESISDLTIKPITGIPIAVMVLFFVFIIVRFLGENLVTHVFEPLFYKYYYPIVVNIVSNIKMTFINQLLIGRTPEVMKSFGILTTGMYIPFVSLTPYIFSFYLVLSFLEDFCYLPRLAVVLDSLFHALGIHGYSSIPIILGLGCKVPALLSIRTLETRREKVITTILILMSAPCMPQTAMILSLGVKYGIATITTIFLVVFIIGVMTSVLINKIMKGEVPEMFMEIPPYRLPRLEVLLKKLWLRLEIFFTEVIPMIAAGVLIINVSDILGFTDFIANSVGILFSYSLNLPKEIASVIMLGFLRKDISIAMLAPFELTSKQFIIASVFLILYLPCIASFFMLLKELGITSSLKIIVTVFLSAFVVAFLLNIVL